LPSTTTTVRPSTTTTVRPSTTTTVPGSSVTVDPTRPTELTNAFSRYDPKGCGINVDVMESSPHSLTQTYEVNVSAGLWSAPSTGSSLLKTIQTESYGPAGFGCPNGQGPVVTVTCKVTNGQTLRNGTWTNSTWLRTSYQGKTGYISDWFVDTRWDIYSIPIC
jgi:hypothetical protein